MNPLNSFYQNVVMRDSVKAFMIEELKEMAVEKTFAGQETKGIKEARDCLDKTFNKLGQMYGKIEEPIISNSR
jgi:hypothetical protein